MFDMDAIVRDMLVEKRCTQRSLMRHLQESGYKLSPGEMSRIVNGRSRTPKADRVLVDSINYLKQIV